MSRSATVLIIDDNPAVVTALEVLLSLHDITAVSASSPAEGLQRLAEAPVDLVIQDMNFTADTTSGEEGEALFGDLRAQYPDLPVILLTAWTHLEAAVALIKAGAADYVAKPWDDDRLITSVRNLLDLGASRRELAGVREGERRRQQALQARYDLCGLVFADPAMERVVSLACQVARADVPVLITGPNGAGKERIARIIQANSAVARGPYVTLNCGALPSELVEAELFGAEAGAYTGATRARAGKFEAADGGTLLLDEIGNLALDAQMKLLRVLETGRFERLGSSQEKAVSVRVLSATNADLPAMIEAGRFREDLYYRLNVIEIAVPPLAERPRDVACLAEAMVPTGKRLGRGAIAALERHTWPGNVRELKNRMQRAALLAPAEVLTAADLGLAPARGHDDDAPDDRAAIEAALADAGGVISQAASDLGLSRQALYRRMDRLGIARPGDAARRPSDPAEPHARGGDAGADD